MNNADLKIATANNYPKGGQHSGAISTGVVVTHVPSRLTAQCESQRSQFRNKAVAMVMIDAGLKYLEENP